MIDKKWRKEEITRFLSEGLLRNAQHVSSSNRSFMSKYSFDNTLSIAISPVFKALSQLLDKYAVDWFLECINKYPEDYFHYRIAQGYTAKEYGMWYPGFDYIYDW